ncbi:NAD(P)-binding domain-containing protein [Acidovorax sp. LjRoot66]|uniref:NAD(P)-binding domain-containing protein n=1 Tax=Acidovorax sp. LjRoot66 TaxID=3342334 RepID=UPI003ECC79C9
MDLQHIGLIGYGEVGKTFALGLQSQPGVTGVGAWDLKFAQAATRDAERAHAAQHGVTAHASVQALCLASDLIISAVTASHTLEVAQQAVAHLRPGTVFLDLNSASPGTKQQAAALIEARGAHYVEAGVMTSVPPYGIRVPMLLGGAQAQALAAVLQAWGMDAKPVSEQLGVASAIKMCRSVMIKGLEALVIESYAAARQYGVEAHVLPTLAETFPSIDWERQGSEGLLTLFWGIALPGLGAGCKAPARSKVCTLQARATPQTAPRPGNPKGRPLPARHSSLRSLRVHMHTRRHAPRLARRQGPSRPPK